MLILLGASPAIHKPGDPDCPFCPGDETDTWETHPGNSNDAAILRQIMNKPSGLKDKQDLARPKDGVGNRQAEDNRRPTFRSQKDGVIFNCDDYGEYSDQAHHAISGNQIMDGEDIEKLIDSDHGLIEKDTGYSVNNCANGVCLPAYPKMYQSQSKKFKGKKWSALTADDKAEAQNVMVLPMKAQKGQAHIGDHDISHDETMPEIHDTTYPEQAKLLLAAIYRNTMDRWVPECGLCNDSPGKQKDVLPPPYRINGRLDQVSAALITHVTSHPVEWKYFLSDYAREYHKTICKHPRKPDHAH